jgi:non-specific serine/threonine protein kinase/serine/threonine-protein kinase
MDQDQTLPIEPEDGDSGDPTPDRPPVDEDPFIGPYRLLEKIGEGGMGEVWLAEQTEPIRRRVALKIIKRGMDTRQVVARFEAERQALALMDHPYVAKVYEAGTTPSGRPYIAMEYVKGTPITDHCDKHQLDIHERLRLIQQVCEGVQHAHQKAIIHRDLKPGNVLVYEQDGRRVPKIIDFGVAKAISQKLTETTMFTQMGALLGTPEYMSPEQADMTGDDVDTRTDVYAIGVILYRLLVGSLPFDREHLWQAGFEGIRRIIREEEPPKPSTRFSAQGAESVTAAHARRTEPPALRRRLQGDLDWITMKALEKDRARRYASPLDLAGDIGRYLALEPVLASPPSPGYRARKFVRRHRAGVAATALAAVLLSGFAVTAAVQARSIARERDRAEAEAAKTLAMNDFLAGTLSSADPWSGGGRDVTVVQALGAAADRIGTAFAGQPEVEASMRTVLGQTYLGLGRLDPAREQLGLAAELRAGQEDADPADLARLRSIEAKLAQESAAYEQAVASAAEAARLLRGHGAGRPDDLLEAYQLQTRNLLFAQRYAEAESVLALSEDLAPGIRGDRRILAAENLSQRADLLRERDGDAAAADSLSRLAFALAESVDPENAILATYLNNAAQYHSESGDFAGALADFDAALALYEKTFGTDHPAYATCLENRGGVLYQMGRVDETFAALEQVRDIRARNLGADHIDVVRTSLNLGTVAMIAGDDGKAVSIYRELKPELIAARGLDHPDVVALLRNEGMALRKLERHDEAESVARQALEIATRLNGEGHPQTATAHNDLGVVLVSAGRPQEAEEHLVGAFDVFLATYGAEHVKTRHCAQWLVKLYGMTGDAARADRYRAHAGD